MTAVAFIRMMAELSGLPPQMALERAHEALFYVGLGEARYRQAGHLFAGHEATGEAGASDCAWAEADYFR